MESVKPDGLMSFNLRPTCKRLARMVCELDGTTKTDSPILGKRGVQQKEFNVELATNEQLKKREKIKELSQMTTMVGGRTTLAEHNEAIKLELPRA